MLRYKLLASHYLSSMTNRIQNALRGYVDGTDKSFNARFFRNIALLLALPYSCVVSLRNRLFDLGWLKTDRLEAVVISVGNITLGGVGKTPFVAWLTRRCLESGHSPGIISRGYKGKKQQKLSTFKKTTDPLINISNAMNDEARELKIRFPNVPHFLGSKRVVVARELLKRCPNVDAIILDDAFQHRRLERDLNIVLLDALNPFGGSRIVPAGYLRESMTSLKRANVVVLSRADLIPNEERNVIRQIATRYAPNALWCEITQRPSQVFYYDASLNLKREYVLRATDYETWLQQNANTNFFAFCGLGAPSGFQKSLENQRLSLTAFETFPDHCSYNDKDFEFLTQKAAQTKANAFITTMKDFVKLEKLARISSLPIFAIQIEVEFISGEEQFDLTLQKLLRDQ